MSQNQPTKVAASVQQKLRNKAKKQKEWKGFLKKWKATENTKTLSEIVNVLKDFLMPPTLAVAKGETFDKIWRQSGLWQNPE
jgi:hypothetical protein